MKKKFTTTWKKSTQVKKQRKYRYNAPLHIKQKFMHSHLSPELRKKHNTRSAQLKTGDKVKILRGAFRKKEGKVERYTRGKIKELLQHAIDQGRLQKDDLQEYLRLKF